MLDIQSTFSSFSVNDLEQAKSFYTDVLGLTVAEEENMGLKVTLPDQKFVFVYPKENHRPATFTVLNFQVEKIDEAVDELARKGVKFERYDGMPADEKGIVRGKKQKMGPDIAWFTDPAGNIFSVIEE